ncbi:MAG TPA: hypothetical protein VF580_03540 [Thermoanaerobaculia bacterium]
MPVDRLVVYTTWYPGVEPYLDAWGSSVREQTDLSFRLVVGVDGITPGEWVSRLGLDSRTRWVMAPAGASPARVRQTALESVVEDADEVVLVDSDDILEPSRVAAAREGLAKSDVVGCALKLADETGAELGGTFGPAAESDAAADLPHHNVFGLSNSAYRVATLRSCLPIPDGCALVDWLLATRAWAFGARLAFDSTPRMVYRQGVSSATRVSPPFSGRHVLAATDLVLGHYHVALENPPALPAAPTAALVAARDRAERFRQVISDSPETLGRYVAALNELPPRLVWWWAVANPELEHLWMN